MIYVELIRYVESLYRTYGFNEVITPQILDASLWKQSGHYDHYKENMFFTEVEGREYGVKPMNCPGHCLMFAEGRHSFRDLPIRLADFGRLHRYELSGATAGLTRVRSFAQDDGHIFCTPDQVGEEVARTVDMLLETYALFGFEVKIVLSTRPDDRAGEDHLWDHSEAALRGALEQRGDPFSIAEGEGAFYGPKIDFFVKDALQREHQLGTCQLDYVLPERFDLNFIDTDDQVRRAVMIHRAMLGSLERFIGILIEHTAGDFPFWLAPEQARVMSITERTTDYALQVQRQLAERGLRVEADVRNEKIGAKIREAELLKVPAMLVVGDREAEQGQVALRLRKHGDQGAVPVAAFVEQAVEWRDRRLSQAAWPSRLES